jgi:hypothetical protein
LPIDRGQWAASRRIIDVFKSSAADRHVLPSANRNQLVVLVSCLQAACALIVIAMVHGDNYR